MSAGQDQHMSVNVDRAAHPDLHDAITESEKHMRLYSIAVDNAIRKIGVAVYNFQPRVIQKALVAEEILALVNAQDEDVADARVRAMTNALWQINGAN